MLILHRRGWMDGMVFDLIEGLSPRCQLIMAGTRSTEQACPTEANHGDNALHDSMWHRVHWLMVPCSPTNAIDSSSLRWNKFICQFNCRWLIGQIGSLNAFATLNPSRILLTINADRKLVWMCAPSWPLANGNQGCAPRPTTETHPKPNMITVIISMMINAMS